MRSLRQQRNRSQQREIMKHTTTVSVTIPQTKWTFHCLPNETNDKSLNRFIHSILSNPDGPRKFVEKLLVECYISNKIDDIVDAEWVDSIPTQIDSIKDLFVFEVLNEGTI